MLVVKLCGLGGMRVCMSSRWRAFVVLFHDRWLSLQPVWIDEAIVDVFLCWTTVATNRMKSTSRSNIASATKEVVRVISVPGFANSHANRIDS